VPDVKAREHQALAVITDAAGDVRAIRSAAFTVHYPHCPRCGWEHLLEDAEHGLWRCLSAFCDWTGL
jgi:hypothetical protein